MWCTAHVASRPRHTFSSKENVGHGGFTADGNCPQLKAAAFCKVSHPPCRCLHQGWADMMAQCHRHSLKQPDSKGDILHDSIHTIFQKRLKPQWQKSNQWSPWRRGSGDWSQSHVRELLGMIEAFYIFTVEAVTWVCVCVSKFIELYTKKRI